ncbi:MAG TPA: isochorismate synthase [Acidimicrobiales bacterium]|nr:isochorismate synthase [Acidimicrobiales bacterium]
MKAVTRRLDTDVDLLDAGELLFERNRLGLAGRGEVCRIPIDEVDATFGSCDVDDEVGLPGCGPVAFGALPFDPDAPAELVLPREVWGRADDGTRWHTRIDQAGDIAGPEPGPATATRGRPAASRFRVEPSRPPDAWCALVEQATKAMADGPLRKVVLAREVVVTGDAAFDAGAVLARLRTTYPGCHLYRVDGFVGASPELLVSRAGDIVRSHPMAGTAARGGDPASDARLAASLLASTKDREEHQITIDMVHDTLLNWCSYVDYEAEPSIVPVANVQHLATLVEGRLSQPAPSILELVRAVHPTPAVCGSPRNLALDFIRAHEGFDRGPYAGAVGWVDGSGNGSFAVSLRCAVLDGPVARIYAGNGIVADSDPTTELAETRAKLQAMLSTLVRP